MASPGEFVRVLYKGRPIFHGERDPRTGKELSGGWEMDRTTPWAIAWDSREYPLTPGRETFVPSEAAVLAFGDPTSGERITSNRDQHGRVGFIPDRATEVRRLRTKYDNMYGDETVVDHYPEVEVYELDGTRITTVLEDPHGSSVVPARQTQQQQSELLDVVKRQQETIAMLMDKVGITDDVPTPSLTEPEPEPEPAHDDVPEMYRDTPPQDDSIPTEATTGERGGRPKGEPALDFSTLGG